MLNLPGYYQGPICKKVTMITNALMTAVHLYVQLF